MNTRTNLRTWRQDSIYCITIEERAGHLRADLEGIACGTWAKITMDGMMERLGKQPNIHTFMISHDAKKGITNPQAAIEEAIKQFKH